MKNILLIAFLFTFYYSNAQQTGTFTDSRDGHVYKTVKIGNQWWMAENMNYKTAKSYCYDEKASNCSTYGRLYPLKEAKTACPSGWHLPSANEFNQMTKSVNNNNYKLKERGSSHWMSNSSATNSTGFTALPGGYLYGNYENIGKAANFWTSEQAAPNVFYYVHFKSSDAKSYFEKEHNYGYSAFSVRCVKD